VTLSGVRFTPKFPAYKKIIAEREALRSLAAAKRLTFTAGQFVNQSSMDAPLPASLAGILAESL
jgi:hypothetical protein